MLCPRIHGYNWCKKFLGKQHNCGAWDDWQAALKRWHTFRDQIEAGLEPVRTDERLTVADLVEMFMDSEDAKRNAGDLTNRTVDAYHASGQHFILRTIRMRTRGVYVFDLMVVSTHSIGGEPRKLTQNEFDSRVKLGVVTLKGRTEVHLDFPDVYLDEVIHTNKPCETAYSIYGFGLGQCTGLNCFVAAAGHEKSLGVIFFRIGTQTCPQPPGGGGSGGY